MRIFGIEFEKNNMIVKVYDKEKKICEARFNEEEIKTLIEEELATDKKQLEIYIIDYVNYVIRQSMYKDITLLEKRDLKKKISIYINNFIN